MSYFITGGAGFVGSHLAERLLARGERVVVLDNFNDYYDPRVKRANIARLGAHPRLHVVEGDIRDAAGLLRLFAEHEVTHVAHLAAMAGVRSSVTQVPLYMEVNTIGSMNVLQAAQAARAHVVLASTSSVYGATQHLPFTETDSADRPLAAYPASKRAAEILAHTYHHLHGLSITVLRFFNVYGPAGRPDMMPMKLMEAALSGAPITVFGDGSLARDWTYIDDTVSGVVAALDKPLGYEVINLGVGSPISLRQFIDLIEELGGRRINRVSAPTPLSEPPITFCNNQKARDLLGFAPSISVQDGMARTWAWFRAFHGL